MSMTDYGKKRLTGQAAFARLAQMAPMCGMRLMRREVWTFMTSREEVREHHQALLL